MHAPQSVLHSTARVAGRTANISFGAGRRQMRKAEMTCLSRSFDAKYQRGLPRFFDPIHSAQPFGGFREQNTTAPSETSPQTGHSRIRKQPRTSTSQYHVMCRQIRRKPLDFDLGLTCLHAYMLTCEQNLRRACKTFCKHVKYSCFRNASQENCYNRVST